MDVATQDQFAAACAEWAGMMRIKRDALLRAGFDHDDTIRVLCASFTLDYGERQAELVREFLDKLPPVD